VSQQDLFPINFTLATGRDTTGPAACVMTAGETMAGTTFVGAITAGADAIAAKPPYEFIPARPATSANIVITIFILNFP